jgi:ribonuclease HII
MTEQERLDGMVLFEREALAQGKKYIIGIDEAGRGPLAGPVVVAGYLFDPDEIFPFVNDSKQVTPKRREELFAKLTASEERYRVVIIEPQEIDAINIYQATLKAMYKVVESFKVTPDYILVDAMPLQLPIETLSLIKGDTRSYSIAAASIIAKEYRDNLMKEYDKLYPHYGFAKHKGYGTLVHRQALQTHGLSPIHRHSFCSKFKPL